MDNNYANLDEINVGMTYEMFRVMTEEKVNAFAEISEDKNPIHVDEDFAKKTVFRKKIAHGLLSASFFSGIFGTKFPGIGSLYVSQDLQFIKPVYIDDSVKIKVQVVEVDRSKRRVYFLTRAFVGDTLVIDGKAEIYVPKKKKQLK